MFMVAPRALSQGTEPAKANGGFSPVLPSIHAVRCGAWLREWK